MLIHSTGSIFDADAEMITNPVNTRGISGKGLAKVFKEKYPTADVSYVFWAKQQHAAPGNVLIVPMPVAERRKSQKYICYFPTKVNWQNPSKIEYIQDGLAALLIEMQRQGISSVALPALGCGLGGLPFDEVRDTIEQVFNRDDLTAYLYAPQGN